MLKLQILSASSLERRGYWVNEIVKISGRFGDDAARLVAELESEVAHDGTEALLDHLRLCGPIPEHYGPDSSEEKLYSKYTDALLAASFLQIGLESAVLEERADAADVEASGADYSLVGDAKVFRLSRTAKNQKDFKIEAMDGWRRDKDHAMVVCPIYQLPARNSQIYQQAIARNVCIFTYSHLAMLLEFAEEQGKRSAQGLLLKALSCAEALNPTKDAVAYWTCVNKAMLEFHAGVAPLWKKEKMAVVESLAVAKEEALKFLSDERKEITNMTREQAIAHLIADRNLDGRERVIKNLDENGILTMV